MNKELLIEQITTLCKEKGVSMHTAFVESGVGKNFKSNLKTSDPSNKNLALLARYFNVTVAYLLGDETTEDLTQRAVGLVIEWLNDNGYEVEQDENDTYTIGKDGRLIHMPSCDFAVESLKIKTASEDGFELAMEDWERRSFPAVSIEHSVDYLLGNEERNTTAALGSDLTEQEKTLLAVYRASSEEGKLRIIQAVMNIRDESEKTHRVYRAARSSDNAEPVIETRSQEGIDKLRNAKTVTCDEDL